MPQSPYTSEPASFRDPDGAVFYADGEVLRGLSEQGARDWKELCATDFFSRLVDAGQIVGTEEYDGESPPSPRGTPWATVLRHQEVPVISYPYEWPFAMLRDAAVLQLDVLLAALEEGMSLKDGSAYNTQFIGTRPTFIDIGSFEKAAGPWPGYRQFCQTMLFPLLVQAHLGMPYQALLRGSLDGLSAASVAGLFSGLNRFRRGVLRNVVLHSALEKHITSSSQDTRKRLTKAGYSTDLVKATARNLRKLLLHLDVGKRSSTWSNYRDTCSYDQADAQAKEDFVGAALAEGQAELVLDLGANDGVYSRLAARHAAYVVAVDADEAVVDALYRRLHEEGEEKILPLVVNLTDPSGGLGWRNRERMRFSERVQPDLVLALALVHHLAIGANVPLPQVVDWLTSLSGRVVAEFVHVEDPMVQRLLANKPEGLFNDYRLETFEALLAERCRIVRRQSLPQGTRTLYLLEIDN